ncbi:MAG: carboxypeptidase, partial [Acidimicrobiia bacterium]
PVEDELKLLKWNDQKLKKKAFVDWYEFDHPQLGKVELGGWDQLHFWGNVPLELLEKEIAPHADFAIFHALISPKLEMQSVEVNEVDTRTFHVRIVLINTGWLPTYVTQKAIERRLVRPVEVRLSLPRDAKVVGGKDKVDVGQLEGRSMKRNMLGWGQDDSTTDRTKIEWIIEAPRRGTLGIEARHERAGVVRQKVKL